MKTRFSKLLALLMALVMVVGMIPAMSAAALADDADVSAEGGEAETSEAGEGDVVILYTNDVHTYIDKSLSYASISQMKKDLKETLGDNNVLLVDAGDHVQGTAYGSMDKGATIIELMKAAGYDLATLGNHEFDYGMARALEVAQDPELPYVSCNFYHEENGVKGDNVLDAYKVFELGGKKVAFIGITTPESFTKSTPAYFQDADGNYIYGIAGGEDGQALYDTVQAAIDDASEEADIVIALGHLGIDSASQPWTSKEVIANTTGLDAFIDGHSHSTVEMEKVADKDGNEVVLTQTGSYFNAIGQMTIAADGTISTKLLPEYNDEEGNKIVDADVEAIEKGWVGQIQEELGQKIGYSEVTFDNYKAYEDENGESQKERLVRKQETNTGDFAADALYYLFDNMGLDVDVAIMNGGGVRSEAITGELTYLSCKSIHTFGNVACLQTVTGQQILDALEWGSRACPGELGGFLQVSGLTYEIHTEIPSTVQMDDKTVWTGGPTDKYRVQNVKVYNKGTEEYEPLDLEAKYNLAGYNYTLRDLGDGFAMFDGAVNVLDYVMEDYMVLANYIESFPVDEETGLHTIPADSDYADVNGTGRITIYYAYGDVNLDGAVTADDALEILKYVVKLPSAVKDYNDLVMTLADADKNTNVTANDALVVLKTVVQLVDMETYAVPSAEEPAEPADPATDEPAETGAPEVTEETPEASEEAPEVTEEVPVVSEEVPSAA